MNILDKFGVNVGFDPAKLRQTLADFKKIRKEADETSKSFKKMGEEATVGEETAERASIRRLAAVARAHNAKLEAWKKEALPGSTPPLHLMGAKTYSSKLSAGIARYASSIVGFFKTSFPGTFKGLNLLLTGVTKLTKGFYELGKVAVKAGGIIVGAMGIGLVSLKKFTTEFSNLYMLAQQVGSTPQLLKSFQQAAEIFGVSDKEAGKTLGGLFEGIHFNPGFESEINTVLTRIGASTRDANGNLRDTTAILLDLLKAMHQMSEPEAKMWADELGISTNLLTANVDQLNQRMNQYAAINKDVNKSAEQANVAQQQYQVLTAQLSNTFQNLALQVFPYVIKAMEWFTELLKQPWLQKFVNGIGTLIDKLTSINGVSVAFTTLMTAIGVAAAYAGAPLWVVVGAVTALAGAFAAALGYGGSFKQFMASMASHLPKAVLDNTFLGDFVKNNPGPKSATGNTAGILDQDEKIAGLQKAGLGGILNTIFGLESNYGKAPGTYTENSKGAMGPFQFLKKTAAGYGVSDRNDFGQSAMGASKMVSELANKYHGDLGLILAAYNYGSGNVDRVGGDLSKMPKETQDYVTRGMAMMHRPLGSSSVFNSSTSAGGITQNNNIVIQGATDPQSTAKTVDSTLNRQNSKLRSLKVVLQ